MTSTNGKSARRYPTPAQRRTTIRVPLAPHHVGGPLPHNRAGETQAPTRARSCSLCSPTFARNNTHSQPQKHPPPRSNPNQRCPWRPGSVGGQTDQKCGGGERSRAENRGPTPFLTPQNRRRQFGASPHTPDTQTGECGRPPSPGGATQAEQRQRSDLRCSRKPDLPLG